MPAQSNNMYISRDNHIYKLTMLGRDNNPAPYKYKIAMLGLPVNIFYSAHKMLS